MLRESNDGFVIAERDLEIRGPGEVLGTKQTGLADFKIADLSRDKQTLTQVRPIAFKMLEQFPTQSEKLIQRWLAGKSDYALA